ncbi:MAG: ATP-dependent 6-phosphofructokinase [Myxococcales bacterium]|jgi:6-phosphofructokinase 1
MTNTLLDLTVKTLGPRTFPSPLGLSTKSGDDVADYIRDDMRVLSTIEWAAGEGGRPSVPAHVPGFEKAGPREHIYFDPKKVTAAIVTCGGLCPGLNSVIRSMVMELYHGYGVRRILGMRYGYEGLNPAVGLAPVELDPKSVESIHRQGGSILGSSRGAQDPAVMVDYLVEREVDVLFTLGGDGTQRGAHQIQLEIERRGLKMAVVGVPKTIDNDVAFVDQTFGFDTAVETARTVLDGAHVEARGARNGVGIVKLMGRDAGFIAAHATLASGEVNFCLVPEVDFELDGEHGLFACLERRLRERSHALIVVAEGCARTIARRLGTPGERDASGNLRYSAGSLDVGTYLRDSVKAHFKAKGIPIAIKYIDPSYTIRSVPPTATDEVFCDRLARNAVHAAMAGKTDVLIGRTHGVFTHVPLAAVTGENKVIDPDRELWLSVLRSTGQPLMRSPEGRT